MNKIIKILIFSDFIILSGFGLISPIFAVFITDHIKDGSVTVAGLASAIYLITKSLLQLPIARFIDKDKDDKDDFFWMVFGTFLLSVAPLLYLISTLAIHIYIIQFIFGLGAALSFPGWFALFTRHINKHQEGFEWSFHSTLVGIGTAVAAAIGGFIANFFGFSVLFWSVSILAILGSILLIFLYKPLKLDKIRGNKN